MGFRNGIVIYIGAGSRLYLSTILTKEIRTAMPAGRPKKIVDSLKSVESPDTGAAATLKFYQERDAKKRKAVMDADEALDRLLAQRRDRKNDGLKSEDEWDNLIGRARTELRIAEEEHAITSKKQLDYEKAVDPSKRDSGEKITVQEASEMLTLGVMHLAFGFDQILHSICSNCGRITSPVEMYEFGKPLFRECISAAIDGAANEKQIDKWAHDAMRKPL